MKFFAIATIVLCVAVVVQAIPGRNSKKEHKCGPDCSDRKKEPECGSVCPAVYMPVCAGKPNDKTTKPRLFGNDCVLSIHNCENKDNLVKISMDNCKESGGVRLS